MEYDSQHHDFGSNNEDTRAQATGSDIHEHDHNVDDDDYDDEPLSVLMKVY